VRNGIGDGGEARKPKGKRDSRRNNFLHVEFSSSAYLEFVSRNKLRLSPKPFGVIALL
jgi:hypothetical protein